MGDEMAYVENPGLLEMLRASDQGDYPGGDSPPSNVENYLDDFKEYFQEHLDDPLSEEEQE
jgi:hypothetical protein